MTATAKQRIAADRIAEQLSIRDAMINKLSILSGILIVIVIVLAVMLLLTLRAHADYVGIKTTTVTELSARRHHYHHRHRHRKIKTDHIDANGNLANNIITTSTGAIARVAAKYTAQFQGLIDDLEINYGAKLLDIGGIRRGRGSIGHQHPLGKAVDFCQLRRDKVQSDCNLPNRATLTRVAAEHGLFSGGQWCNGDHGHIQVVPSGTAHCHEGSEVMMAKSEPHSIRVPGAGSVLMARNHRHHHRVKVARYHYRHRHYARHHWRIREDRRVAAYAMPNSYDMRWGASQ